jgi:hypothetical protein
LWTCSALGTVIAPGGGYASRAVGVAGVAGADIRVSKGTLAPLDGDIIAI